MNNRKPIIMHHLNNLCAGGSELMVQTFLKYLLLLSKEFNHVLAFKAHEDRTREHFFREILGDKKLIPYASIPEFIEIIKVIQPEILHVTNAGIAEFPLVQGIKTILPTTKLVQTSVFSNRNDQVDLDAVIHVSKHVQQITGNYQDPKAHVIRNPVEPVESCESLRKELNIDEDVFVFGHIGRPDPNTYDDLNIRAYSKIETPRTCFIVLGVDKFAKEIFEKYSIQNYRLIEKTVDKSRIDAFYNTINVLAHSRKDGECNSAVIFEAFSAGIPVISAYGTPFNGHIEQIQNAGLLVQNNDLEDYARCMDHFYQMTKEEYSYFSYNASKLWTEMADPYQQTLKFLALYETLLRS